MGLTQGTLRELRSELVNLQRRRHDMDVRIRSIELLLSLRPNDVPRAREDHRRKGVAVKLPAVTKRKRATEGSLRIKLTELLQRTSGLATAELADRLHQEGFQVGGSASLRQRVSHELSRLRRMKIVRKRQGGKYTLTAGKAEERSAGAERPELTEATP